MKSIIFLLLLVNLTCKQKQINQISKAEVTSEIKDTNNVRVGNKNLETKMINEEFKSFWKKFITVISKNDMNSFLRLSSKKIGYNQKDLSADVFVKKYFQTAFDENMKRISLEKDKVVFSRSEVEGAYEPVIASQVRNERGNFWNYEVYIDIGLIKPNIRGEIELEFVETDKGFLFIRYSLAELNAAPNQR